MVHLEYYQVFQFPSGIAIDSKGNIFIADSENHRIQKLNPFFVYMKEWGRKGSGEGEFFNLCN